MGIRFNCSNGHRLNVKSFQAGKRGFCPHCGVSVLIPERPDNVTATAGSTQADDPSTEVQKAVDQVTNSRRQPTDARLAAQPGVGESADATKSQWFVRPAAGGQYGPADEETLNNWVAEGRIGSDTLFWREGWENWRYAGEVLPALSRIPQPDLVPPTSTPTVDVSPATQDAQDIVDVRSNTDERVVSHSKRRARRFSAALIAGLGIVSILLVVALVMVVRMDR